MKNYPETATERFDNAKFHRRYCISFIKKFINGKILEIGAGCGSFTKDYININRNITLTETDKKNFDDLKKIFKDYKNVKVTNNTIYKETGNFDTILYLHVLEHIEDDFAELNEVYKKLNKNGHLIILVPAYQKLYSGLDKTVGHFRRYERDFFKNGLVGFKRIRLLSLDTMGYLLYSLNKIFFKNENVPSNFKIFIWDKIFTPITLITDCLTNYKFGKSILAIYKKD